MPHVRVATMLFSLAALAVPAAAEEDEGPELAFNGHCRSCHSIKEGDNRLGPTMYGIMGKKAGTVAGYNTSPSLRNSSVIWTDEVMDQWIADPSSVAAGNSMSPPYAGIADAKIRADIVTFLNSAKAGGKGGGAEPATKVD